MIQLTLPFPPSANRYWRHARGRTYLSKDAKQYRQDVMDAVVLHRFDQMRQGHPSAPAQLIRTHEMDNFSLRGPLEVTITLYPPDGRHWDLDNRIKQLLDALEHAGVFEDDEQIVSITAKKMEKVKGGRCDVIIERKRGE